MTNKEFIELVEDLGLSVDKDNVDFYSVYDESPYGPVPLVRVSKKEFGKMHITREVNEFEYSANLLSIMTEYALTSIVERSNKKYKIKIKGEWVCDGGDCILMLDKEDLATAYKGHEIELIEVEDD